MLPVWIVREGGREGEERGGEKGGVLWLPPLVEDVIIVDRLRTGLRATADRGGMAMGGVRGFAAAAAAGETPGVAKRRPMGPAAFLAAGAAGLARTGELFTWLGGPAGTGSLGETFQKGRLHSLIN